MSVACKQDSFDQKTLLDSKSQLLLEEKVLDLGKRILASQNQKGVLSTKGLAKKLMDWSLDHSDLKTALFRFIDVLPTLVTASQIARHVQEYLIEAPVRLPPLIRPFLLLMTNIKILNHLLAWGIKKNVRAMATLFITGTNAGSAQKNLLALWNNNSAFTVDILGEAVISKVEAAHYQKNYIDLVENLSSAVKLWPAQPQLEQASYFIPRANVSVKCSSLCHNIDPLAFSATVEAIKQGLRPILRCAKKNQVFIYLDMEQHDYKEIIMTVAKEIFSEVEFADYPHFGLVLQTYLKSATKDVADIIAYAKKRGTPLGIRLVKGAYWDYEVIMANSRGHETPVFRQKAQSDVCYEACTKMLLQAFPVIHTAFASHNVRSLSHAVIMAQHYGLKNTDIEIQMLYGMANAFKDAVSAMGLRVREYAPVGEVLPGMAYLVRRLLENTSNEGFLKTRFFDKLGLDRLLVNPQKLVKE